MWLAYFFTHGTFATSKAYDSLASKNEQQFFSAWLQHVDQILKYDKCNCLSAMFDFCHGVNM